MIKVGKIQEKIIAYLRDCPGGRAYIGPSARCGDYFGAMYFEELEPSLNRLVARNILTVNNAGIYTLEKFRVPDGNH